MLGHHLAEDRPATYCLRQRDTAGPAGTRGPGASPKAAPRRPRPWLPEAHPALELQPRGARSHIPPGPLQHLLLRQGDPAPVVPGLSVTAKRPIGVSSKGLPACVGLGCGAAEDPGHPLVRPPLFQLQPWRSLPGLRGAHLSCPHWAWAGRASLSRALRLGRLAPLGASRARVKAHCTVTATECVRSPAATPWGQAEGWQVSEALDLHGHGGLWAQGLGLR